MTHQATSKKTTQVENIFADVTFRVDKETPICVYHCERGNTMTTRRTKRQAVGHKITIRDRATGILIGSGIIIAKDSGKALAKALQLWAFDKAINTLSITTDDGALIN